METPSENPAPSLPGNSEAFQTTHWSVVLEAGRQGSASAALALEHLCGRYWHPIYSYIRHRGSTPHEAEDLTQSFFLHLLERETLSRVDRSKGKFRSFLLGSLKYFLNNEWQKQHTEKRGGKFHFVSLDNSQAEELYSHEPVDLLTPDKLFARRWAAILIERALARLKDEYAKDGRLNLFNALEHRFSDETVSASNSELATELGMNENAVRVALHRMRQRFRQFLRSEIAYTVSGPAEVDEEIRHLFSALSISQ
jgi:RNA polymerase sigma factor (sigma-70 family)